VQVGFDDPRRAVRSRGGGSRAPVVSPVAWWTAGPPDVVYVSRRPAGTSDWTPPVQVTASSESGRGPSVAVHDGVIRVSYERESTDPTFAQDVVVATQQTDGNFTAEVAAKTQRTDRLDAILHLEYGKLWVDWKHGADRIGYCQ